MTDLTDALDRDDDTGRIAREVLMGAPAPVETEIKALRIALAAHVAEDRRQSRVVLGGIGLMITVATAMLAASWTAASEDGRQGEVLATVARDVQRIEAHVERLDDRMNREDRP